MPTSEDYFENITALEPGKRHTSRLDNNRILKAISNRRNGYELNWTIGKASFMKSYKTKIFPRWFANPGDNVHIQVSIRLLPGETAPGAPVFGLSGIEVYYRFLKIIALIDKGTEKEELPEEERTEFQTFSTGKDIVEATQWEGSVLHCSQAARLFYNLLQTIGLDKVKKVMDRINEKNK